MNFANPHKAKPANESSSPTPSSSSNSNRTHNNEEASNKNTEEEEDDKHGKLDATLLDGKADDNEASEGDTDAAPRLLDSSSEQLTAFVGADCNIVMQMHQIAFSA